MLYQLNRGVSKSVGLSEPEKGKADKEYTKSYSVKGMMAIANEWLSRMSEGTSRIADYHDADYPAGPKSNSQKRKNNLIKIYADHLNKVDKMNPKNALIRARFELTNFYETDKIIQHINDAIDWDDRIKFQKEYYHSDVLSTDVKNKLSQLVPYYIYAPVYDFLVKQTHYSDINEGVIGITLFGVDNDYDDFVETRAIIDRLEQLKVIKKVKDGMRNWNMSPEFKFLITDPEKIKVLVYEGGSSHENSFFEERYQKGDLKSIFYMPGGV